MTLPLLYVIADAVTLARHDTALGAFAQAMQAAGVTLLQYRDKSAQPQAILAAVAEIRRHYTGTLILNDRADLAALAEADGVHVGQGDLSPSDARRVFGPSKIIGLSTHTDQQVLDANSSEATYIAIGPVFATVSKSDAEPPVGLEGVRRARALTTRPLVAIGGITLANARSVLDAGADSIAVISALFVQGESLADVARDFLHRLR
jgi:thiamine-phosphate pyrophosphorylase